MTEREWGSTRHGTPSGYNRHQDLNERPCPFCYLAKQEYDKRLRTADAKTRANRRSAKAQSMAYQRLAKEFPDKYRQYYTEAKESLE